jgi:oxygen-independent coproporphyrinogen-3 oxidase
MTTPLAMPSGSPVTARAPAPSPGKPHLPFLPRAVPEKPVQSLYVHVPFCAHKCEYCAFYSALPKGDLVQRYVQALVLEMEMIAPHCRPQTVFFGGGTPSLLNLRQWETVLAAMDRLRLTGAREWTVECNPATVSADKARLLRDHGVNRISMGVQSLDETLLERLGRIHTRDMVFRSLDILRAAGFDNISIDLMFAIPFQTLEMWDRTLDEALALQTEHLSCYEVIYEEDTPLFQQLQAGEFDVDEDLACDMYERLVERAAAAGLQGYEIANFARHDPSAPGWGSVSAAYADPALPSRACRHNVGYWRAEDSFGLGPSASESIGNTRTRNWANTPLYCEELEQGRRAREFSETLSPEARAGEIAAFGLRMNAGWPLDLFHARTGRRLEQEWAEPIRVLVGRGWGELLPDRFRLTDTGRRFADAAGALFLR